MFVILTVLSHIVLAEESETNLNLLGVTANTIQQCSVVKELPNTMQVAWISPVAEQVWASENIEVLRLYDLQVWLSQQDQNKGNAVNLLLELGMLPKRKEDKNIDPADYKITIFDVETEILCRPVDIDSQFPQDIRVQNPKNTEAKPADVVIEGISVCAKKSHKPSNFYARYGYTGCGYTWNPSTDSQGFDVYRVEWKEASRAGFCVFPLERFLVGPSKQ